MGKRFEMLRRVLQAVREIAEHVKPRQTAA